MWARWPISFSRQALREDLSFRGSDCACRAKRYVPSRKQRKSLLGGAQGGRKPSVPEPTDPVDLLRELNAGGVGWLRDEEEQDWGLDDVAEHAKARQQKHHVRGIASLGSSLPTSAGSARASGDPGSIGRRDFDSEAHDSLLASGVASISAGEGLYNSPAAVGSPSSLSARGRGGEGPPAVQLASSYVRRNPEVVEALRLRGVAVGVQETEGGADSLADEVTEDLDIMLGTDLDHDNFEDDDGVDVQLDLHQAANEVGDGGRPSRSNHSGRGSDAGIGDVSGSRDWYRSLAAAGFTVQTNAAGPFLERTVRRKTAGRPTVTSAAASVVSPSRTPTGATPPSAGAGAVVAGSPQPLLPPPPPLVTPLEPISTHSPSIIQALKRLTTPQQVLDFLELSFSHWAANGYRLVDMRSGRPVAAPSPAEAASCLRALSLTARRADIGGWRCLELAASRQVKGLAEALRVTPPRLLPGQAPSQLTSDYFEAARRFWLDPTAEPMIGDPRVASPMALISSDGKASATGLHNWLNDAGSEASEAVYDSLVEKYTKISQYQKLKDASGSWQQQQQEQQQQQQSGARLVRPLKDTPVPTADANAKVVRTDVEVVEATLPTNGALRAAPLSAAADTIAGAGGEAVTVASGPVEAALRRAAKIECLVSALWGMSSLGGAPYFEAETEAVVTILVRTLTTSYAAAAPPPGQSPKVAAALVAAPGGLSGWQVGQVLWALGNSRHVTPRLPDLETNILRSGGLSSMQPRDVTRVLWGFASLGYRPERLLLSIRPDWTWREATATAAEGNRGSFPDVHKRKGNTRDAISGSGGGGKDRKGRVASKPVCGDVRSFSLQQLAGVVWALAVMGQVDTGPFRSAWARLLCHATEVPQWEPVLTQIWQANLSLHLESSTASTSRKTAAVSPLLSRGADSGARKSADGSRSAEDLTAVGLAAAAEASAGGTVFDETTARSLLLRARDVFLSTTSGLRRKVQSGYQRQMANSLTGLRLMHLLEDNSTGYSIDITMPQLKIALEADGPTHISRTPGGAVLGATAMKRRHLQRMGWHVINVTYKTWDKLTSESSRRAFLQERINEALLSRIQLSDEDHHEGGQLGAS